MELGEAEEEVVVEEEAAEEMAAAVAMKAVDLGEDEDDVSC